MMRLRPLVLSDISNALRLSEQAGWNQIDQDWRRLVALWPDTCLAGVVEGQLVATGTVACFEDIGWIGMILVDESQRGRGLGSQMFRAVVEAARGHGVQRFGLDATDLGRPVYLKSGFADHSAIARWIGRGMIAAPQDGRAITEADWPAVLELDRQAVGVDRGPLLRRLVNEPGSRTCVIHESNGILGAGWLRQGGAAAMIGPVVAASADVAARVCTNLLAHAGNQSVIMDLPSGNSVEAVLSRQGFTVQRRLTRMAKAASDAPLLTGPQVFAGAGFELG
ncbi:MAG: GNAT family N-acetyltransferase [Phycisphaeraceae bacterium]